MFRQIFDSPQLIIRKQGIQNFQLKSAPTFKNEEEGLRWQFFNIGNPYLSEDGRTYNAIDKNGRYISNFVSQYSPIIENNIEPKIKNLVRSFHKKGYLTVGSCQAHSLKERRWISFVFDSDESRTQFVNKIKISKISCFFEYDIPLEPRDGDLNDFVADESYKSKIWSILVHRQYETFFQLRLVFGPELKERRFSFLNKLEELKYEQIYSRYRLEKDTQRLISFVDSKLPPYTG
jgi:hypothetical protein